MIGSRALVIQAALILVDFLTFNDGLKLNSGYKFVKTPKMQFEQEKAVKLLLQRLIPGKEDQFEIEVDFHFDDKDVFEISTRKGKIYIKGNKGYSAAAGIYDYLKTYCGGHVSWSGNQLNLPDYLPRPKTEKKFFNDKYRYYQNVCASSYSYVWWTWDRWEQEIDWMALNGINLALAFTAQEAIQAKVFKSLNFTDHQIGVFFTGPAFLAWNRMGNVQAWAGPLTENWYNNQISLQHLILKRMRSFGMIPVLPAFSGRVMPAFKSIFPDAQTTYLKKEWGHFKPPFGEVTFLEPTDPLFKRIGSLFLEKYIAEFGTNNIYNTDLFNEMPPPSNTTEYLANCSRAVYDTLTAVDPEATWITQGWMFFSDPDFWQPEQAKAFLTAVPLGKMIVLDLQSEMYPQYQRLDSYYGQPFIWCMLHNYGGVSGLYGSLEQINSGPFEGRNFKGSTMIGTGITPEGIETNDIVYELMNEMAWRDKPVDLDTWIEGYALRRYGVNSPDVVVGLLHLKRSVYNATAPNRNHGHYVLTRRPSLKLTDDVWYDDADVFTAWSLFLNATEDIKLANSSLFRHDLVDLSRQSLQIQMGIMYEDFCGYYKTKQTFSVWLISHNIGRLYDSMEELLASDEHFLLGKWLYAAKSLGVTATEKTNYEYNAKNQITLWGPYGELLDYASKQWSGLMKDYYKERWDLFFKTVLDCLHNNSTFNQSEFNNEVFQKVESYFALNWKLYPTEPTGDPVAISKKIFKEYHRVSTDDELKNEYMKKRYVL